MRSMAIAVFAVLVTAMALPASALDRCQPGPKPICMAAETQSLIEDVARRRTNNLCGCKRVPKSEQDKCSCLCANGYWDDFLKICW